MQKFKLALVQMNSGNDLAANVAELERSLSAAHARGAQLIATPENTGLLGADTADTLSKAQPEAAHPALSLARSFAKQHSVWILLGSIHVRTPDEDRVRNRSYLIGADGNVAAFYDKIHMFDAKLAHGEYRESATFAPGDRAVLATTPWGRLGMTICYDLRFAQLYRTLAQAGATMLSVPAAFTVPTGQAHWHTLLRARAIEHGCYVLAPAQVGLHANGRHTFGHSLIVAPWGEVLADAGDAGPAIVLADIDPQAVLTAREALPSLRHDRAFALHEQ
jgi:deaminated glutathione amidase